MDTDIPTNPFETPQEEEPPLPYDDVPVPEKSTSEGSKLASRIGARVYLLSESSASLHGRLSKKRKSGEMDHDQDEDPVEVGEGDVTADVTMRDNAIAVQGTPIAQLPTAKIFAWAALFHDTPPMALEWINDNTVLLLYKTSIQARAAFEALVQDSSELPNEWGQFLAHGIPITLWPTQARLEKLMVKGGGLEGDVLIRWATVNDVKKRGAAKGSKFYEKFGADAGKEGRAPVIIESDRPKRQRGDRERHHHLTEAEKKAELDEELDNLGPSAERSDGSKSPRERTPLSGRLGGRQANRSRGRRGGGRDRPAPTKDDLDAELESFLKTEG